MPAGVLSRLVGILARDIRDPGARGLEYSHRLFGLRSGLPTGTPSHIQMVSNAPTDGHEYSAFSVLSDGTRL